MIMFPGMFVRSPQCTFSSSNNCYSSWLAYCEEFRFFSRATPVYFVVCTKIDLTYAVRSIACHTIFRVSDRNNLEGRAIPIPISYWARTHFAHDENLGEICSWPKHCPCSRTFPGMIVFPLKIPFNLCIERLGVFMLMIHSGNHHG